MTSSAASPPTHRLAATRWKASALTPDMWSRLAAEWPARASGSSARRLASESHASAVLDDARGAVTATTATMTLEMTAVRVASRSQTKVSSWER